MMAYMNKTSLEKTVETRYTYFWSRSRQKYWKKGETSGHVQEVKAILYYCDKDTVLIKVIQHGPGACHTGHRSCFFTEITEKRSPKVFPNQTSAAEMKNHQRQQKPAKKPDWRIMILETLKRVL
jgi:phosphoribosyl-AMP cyclohydrolase